MAHVYKVGDKGKTVDGRDYEVLMIEPRLEYPLVVLFTTDKNQTFVSTRNIDGSIYRNKKLSGDLIPPVRYAYLNIYKDGGVIAYTNEAAARNAALSRSLYFSHVAFRVELPR